MSTKEIKGLCSEKNNAEVYRYSRIFAVA